MTATPFASFDRDGRWSGLWVDGLGLGRGTRPLWSRLGGGEAASEETEECECTDKEEDTRANFGIAKSEFNLVNEGINHGLCHLLQ